MKEKDFQQSLEEEKRNMMAAINEGTFELEEDTPQEPQETGEETKKKKRRIKQSNRTRKGRNSSSPTISPPSEQASEERKPEEKTVEREDDQGRKYTPPTPKTTGKTKTTSTKTIGTCRQCATYLRNILWLFVCVCHLRVHSWDYMCAACQLISEVVTLYSFITSLGTAIVVWHGDVCQNRDMCQSECISENYISCPALVLEPNTCFWAFARVVWHGNV